MISSGLGRREPCASCGEPVFLAQLLHVEKRLFHRTCFKCVQCGAQLTLASYHHRPTDPEGRYCCETCPDEETDSQGDDTNSDTYSNQDVSSHDNVSTSDYNQVMSDEEKVRNIQQLKCTMTAEQLSFDHSLETKIMKPSNSSKAFAGFLNSQFEEETPPALPASSPPPMIQESFIECQEILPSSESVSTDNIKFNDLTTNNELLNSSVILCDSNKLLCSSDKDIELCHPVPLERKSKLPSNLKIGPSPAPRGTRREDSVHIDNDNVNQLLTASDFRENNVCEYVDEVSIEDDKIIAKDKMRYGKSDSFVDEQVVDVEISQASSGPSLVKSRMKLFEQVTTESTDHKDHKVSSQDSQTNVIDQDTLNIVNSNKIIRDSYTSNIIHKSNNSVINASKQIHPNIVQEAETEPSIHNIESQKSETNVPRIDNVLDNDSTSDEVVILDVNNAQNMDTHNKSNGNEDVSELIAIDTSDVNVHGEQSDSDTYKVEKHSESETAIKDKEEQNNVINEQETNNLDKIITNGNEMEQCENLVNIKLTKNLENKNIPPETFVESCVEVEIKNPFRDDSDEENVTNNGNEHKQIDVKQEFQEDLAIDKSQNETNNVTEPQNVLSQSSTIELGTQGDLYPEELNPFCSDEEKEADTANGADKASTNPFGSCSEDEEEAVHKETRRRSSEKPPRPPPPAILVQAIKQQNHNTSDKKKKIIPAPNLNPFGSEDESEEEDLKVNLSTPTPRSRLSEAPPSFHGSSSSLVGTQRRKKPPAPRPPTHQLFTSPPQDGPPSINLYSSTPNSQASPQVSPRSRKRRPAPPPPTMATSSSHSLLITSSPLPSPQLEHSRSSSVASHKKVISAADFDEQDLDVTSSGDWSAVGGGLDKSNTSQYNMDKVSLSSQEPVSICKSITSRRRKGPAPAIPRIGSRGPVSAGALRRELTLLEEQQRGLERQGVRLETLIRERTEGKDPPPEGTTDLETDELLLQLFDLVNEKNELFRRQAELMYLRKQQRLEEEQADLEQQVRVLMCVEESNKTDTDKQREEALLARLVDVVQRRDLVVAALDQERLRERAEDQAVRERMTLHRAKLEELSSMSSADTQLAEKKEKKKKKLWMKKDKGKKAETGVVEVKQDGEGNIKKTKHKKWFK